MFVSKKKYEHIESRLYSEKELNLRLRDECEKLRKNLKDEKERRISLQNVCAEYGERMVENGKCLLEGVVIFGRSGPK